MRQEDEASTDFYLGLEPNLDNLSITKDRSRSSKGNVTKSSAIADSWEDEDASSDTETDEPSTRRSNRNMPGAPPPTPISPTSYQADFEDPYAVPDQPGLGAKGDRERPTKTNATAGRLIAGALGVKAPKRTEEQRAYDKAMKEKEIRSKEKAKEGKKRAEEEVERAKESAWED